MPLLVLLGLALLLALMLGPQAWVRRAMRRHGGDRPDLPGTGGELARHLLDRAGLQDVPVELTAAGDHYDPVDRAVRLTPDTHDGRSVTAVAVATHEVSHALQHADGSRLLTGRVGLAQLVRGLEVAAALVLAFAPVVAALVRSPAVLGLQLALVVALLASRVLLHLVTLPVELDASFRRALPILDKGGYLAAADRPAARQVLRAAAFTYVAGALGGLLDLARIARLLRFW